MLVANTIYNYLNNLYHFFSFIYSLSDNFNIVLNGFTVIKFINMKNQIRKLINKSKILIIKKPFTNSQFAHPKAQ